MNDWRAGALCSQVDPERFFPGPGESTTPAKRVCSRCDVRAACLADALALRPYEDYGVRGGLSERQRATLRRQRANRPPVPVVPLPTPTVPAQSRKAAA